MSDIPGAREKLTAIADELHRHGDIDVASEIMAVVNTDLHRQKAIRKAPRQSRTVTPHLRRAIVNYTKAFPAKTQGEVAHYFAVNPGRVSEALRNNG